MSSERKIRRGLLLSAAFLLAAFAPSLSRARPAFSLQILPGERPDEKIAWHDVNGDGRKDFVRQFERRLEVYFLGPDHAPARKPDWAVEIAPPWDLWAFGDVRPDLPGEELLALSPKGVGWTSFRLHTTSTAQMEMLIQSDIPLSSDNRYAREGEFVVRLQKNGPAELILPTRSGFRLWRQRAGGGWEQVEEFAAPMRPWTFSMVWTNRCFLVGFHLFPGKRGFRSFGPLSPTRARPRNFKFLSSWNSNGGWLIDWNGDGRLDWVHWSSGRGPKIEIALQGAGGRFDRAHPLSPKWLSSSWHKPKQSGGAKRGNESPPEPGREFLPALGRMNLESLADVNGDGRLDLVRVSAVENWAIPKTRIEVYLQRADGSVGKKPDATLRRGAVLPTDYLPLVDLDGDGDLDLLLLRIDLEIASLNSQMKTFVRNGLETYLGAYLWQGDRFTRRPAWEKRIVIGHELFEFTRDPQPLMQFTRDLTGDGRPDLVLRLTRDKVGLFEMKDPARKGFANEAAAILQVPFAIDWIRCDDFDGDGRTDVFVQGWEPENRDREPRAVFFNTFDAGKEGAKR